MEQVREQVVANDIAGNAELRGKGCDLPLKLEGHNMLGSPIMCASDGRDWPESLTHDYLDASRIEDKDSSRCEISLAGSEPSQTSPCPMIDAQNVVEELTMGNYGNKNLALVTGQDDNRQGRWKHTYQLPSVSRCKSSLDDYVSEDREKIFLRVGEQQIKMTSDLWSLKPSLTERTDHDSNQISACLRMRNKGIIPSSTLPNGDASLKTSPTSNFSQLLVKRPLKQQGVVHRNIEGLTEFGSVVLGHIDEKLGHARKVASDALVRSSANGDHFSLHRIERAGPESLHCGISLREWLKPGFCKRDKVESLMIFRQTVQLVDLAHSQGVALQDLRPSFFNLLPSNRIMYTGSSAKTKSGASIFHDLIKKRPLEQDVVSHHRSVAKQQKVSEGMQSLHHSQFTSVSGFKTNTINDVDFYVTVPQEYEDIELHSRGRCNYHSLYMTTSQHSNFLDVQLEEKWYRSPEQLEGHTTFASNIYSLGILLFELLSCFESVQVHSAAMVDLRHRILPPKFLSDNPKEAGFCLWLLHPEPSSRPTAREILQSELTCQSLIFCFGNNVPTSPECDDTVSESLLHFLNLLEEEKRKLASKLTEEIECLEEDIKQVEKRHLLRQSTVFSQTQEKFPDAREQGLHFAGSSVAISKSFSTWNVNEIMLLRHIKQIEHAYFSMRSQIQLASSALRSDIDLLKNRDRLPTAHKENKESNVNLKSVDPLGAFFEGLCKFAQYNKFEVCGFLKTGDLLSSTNVVCSLSFDRDEDYIAAAGVSKKIKVFEFGALLNDFMDVHYPVVEMSNKSKLSCVCWNNYIKNYLASTDYDGTVQLWDAGNGQGFSRFKEHQKRAWSVDFSLADPMVFASGSDDCSVKLWSINERSSLGTIWSPANVCCVQFSASSTYMLVFGSANYKVYCYDLRHTRIPWCTLAGHEKAVSYVKFLDSETLVSASTDNTLKLWDLNKTSSTGLSSSACSLTFSGHTNVKNFVGLSVLDGYMACGSETNEVYCYYRSLPMPITSHKFGYVDPISGNKIDDGIGQFVSSVCWRKKSNMVVAANSGGNMKLLKLV